MNTVHRLDEVCEVVMGQAPSGDAYNTDGKGWPLIAGAGDFGETRPQAKKFTTEASKLSRDGDIVLGIRASIGEKVLADGEYCLGRGVAALRARKLLEPRFLWHWLDHSAPCLAAKAKGATFKQVNREDIAELEIPLPPLAEQLRIAEVLDRAEALRAKRRAVLAQLDSLTQSIFIDLFGEPLTRGKNGGETVRFGHLTTRITYGFTCPMEHISEGVPIITVKNIRHGFIDFQNCHYATEAQFGSLTDKCKPKEGDLLITKDGAIRGRCAVVTTRSRFCISQAVALVRPERSMAVPEYLWGYIVNDRIQRKIMDMDKGVAMPHLQITELAKFPVVLPPLALQREFAHQVAAVEKLKTAHRASLAELDALFASLQHCAFRGEL